MDKDIQTIPKKSQSEKVYKSHQDGISLRKTKSDMNDDVIVDVEDNTPVLKIPQDYIKTVQRRGNIYMIKESLSDSGDTGTCDGTEQMLSDAYRDALKIRSKAEKMSTIYRFLYMLTTFYLIVVGTIIGIITLPGYVTDSTAYVASVLSFSITAIQTFVHTFSIGKKATFLTQNSLGMNVIARKIAALQISEKSDIDKRKEMDTIYPEMDDLQLKIYGDYIQNNDKENN